LILPRTAIRRRILRPAAVAVFVISLGLTLPGAAMADDGRIKLTLLPVGQAGSFFDLTMGPGRTRTFEVDIANDGDSAIAARTYGADVYTIVNGGFGGRLRDQPRTGTTTWIDYPTAVLQLASGERTRRTFTVKVPPDAQPGEYITSLILENDRPIQGVGAIGLAQVVRQAVAVVVTVPGRRTPELAIGTVSHDVVAGRSIVRVAVENVGNVRLKPQVGFVLTDPSGRQVSQATFQMDTFYSHTDTFVEFPLAALLTTGTYLVELTLDDAAQAVHVERSKVVFDVEAPAVPSATTGLVPDLIGVDQAPDSTAPVAFFLLVGVLLAIGLGILGAWLRGTRRSGRTRSGS
jgi:hypothetical protein